MAQKTEKIFEQIEKRLADTLRTLPALLGNEVVNFAHDNFDRQSFNGKAWAKRKNPNKWGKKDDTDRALLVKTGALRRSIRVAEVNKTRVKIVAGGADVPYAKAHNEGVSGEIIQNVNPFTRRGKNLKYHKVRGFKRKIRQNIPRRQFISGTDGSEELKNRINNLVKSELNKIFKP